MSLVLASDWNVLCVPLGEGIACLQQIEDPILTAPLAEALAIDSGSEEEEEVDELTLEQLQQILEEEEEEDAGPDGNFEWAGDFSTFRGTREQFVEEVGSQIDGISPSDIFCQLWDQPLLQNIVNETNKYAWQSIAQAEEREPGIPPNSRMHDWVETNINEVYKLIAIMILMGICVRGRVDEYWTTWEFLQMPGFRKIITKNRFLLLMRFLHFTDNDYILEHGDQKKIAKIKPVVDHLNEKFKTAYSPRRELSIDESLLLWKGRLSWVQCIRTKAARFGIKSYELCEAVSGYVLKMIIYTGKGTTNSEPVAGFRNSTSKVVLNLIGAYLRKGYTLFMDNFYNSVELCRYLKSQATDVVGTLNRRRQNTPAEIKSINERTMPRGSVVGRHCGDVSVIAWKDVKMVTTVSTYHNDEVVEGRRAGSTCIKPALVEEYNKYMGGVDLKDQKLSMYLLERKRGTKWYIKVFRRLVNISILNSYVIYKSNASSIGLEKVMTHRQFRYALAAELCQRYGSSNRPRAHQPQEQALCARLDRSADHFPDQSEVDGERTTSKQNRFKRARCVRCIAIKKRTTTSTFCSHCKVYLCLGQCWREYHTLQDI